MTENALLKDGQLHDFRPTKANPNSHTQRGLDMLANAVSEDGWVAPLTVAADGGAMLAAPYRALRLIEMVRLLRERSLTTIELAGRLSVSNRTVQRDLLALQGEPLYIPLTQNGVAWTILRGWRF